MDEDVSLPLVCVSYVGHPVCTNHSGEGVAKLLIDAMKTLGFSEANLRDQLRGGTFDGAILHINVRHLCQAMYFLLMVYNFDISSLL